MTKILDSENPEFAGQVVEARIDEVLRRIGICLHIPIDLTDLDLGEVPQAVREMDDFGLLVAGGRQAGVLIQEAAITPEELRGVLIEGFPVIIAHEDHTIWLLERLVGNRIEACRIDENFKVSLLRRSQLRGLLSQPGMRLFIAKKELECDSLSSTPGHDAHSHAGDHHAHPKPLRRFLSLLRLDRRDIWTVVLFASVAGILTLATPLAVESLVNVVSWGTYVQPVLVLGVMLLACLGLAGFLRILQTVVVEIIQRRQMVRIVGDLAHRFPRAKRSSLAGVYPREFANRVFDIMTIQKASAVLLLDGLSIVLTTVLGLVLRAFYHPFLLGFDLLLLFTMLSMTWILGRGGIRTAIDESLAKYRIAHWLQDVLSFPTAFKVNGGELLAVERANRIVIDYLAARQKQFSVVLRQVAFAISLQVVASTVLLGLGGWLVMRQQLTLGQLVASELVVTAIVGAFAKAGKSLEKFYDLMAGIDKVGHLLDIPVDVRSVVGEIAEGPAEVRWEGLVFHLPASGTECEIRSARVAPGAKVAFLGDDQSGKSLLMRALAGLSIPERGIVEVAGLEAQRAALDGAGRLVSYAGDIEIFHGTIQENIDLGRQDVGQNRVREVLQDIGLWDAILQLPAGLRTVLETDGNLLSRSQRAQICIARAMVGRPKLLLIDGIIDHLSQVARRSVWQALSAPSAPWTLLIATNDQQIIDVCSERIILTEGSETIHG
jgi:putative ABC transport system ATP-binding protein